MEYAKDEIFNIKYNVEKDKLEIGKAKKHFQIFKRNKFITLLLVVGGIIGGINFVLIYNFITILEKL